MQLKYQQRLLYPLKSLALQNSLDYPFQPTEGGGVGLGWW